MPIAVPATINAGGGPVYDFEIRTQRRQTSLQIKLYGVYIQIVRLPPKSPTISGGVARGSSSPIVFPAVKRLMGFEGHEVQESEPGAGVGRRYRRYLIGTFDDDLQKGDTFIDPESGLTMQVQFVNEDRTTETKANIEPIN